MRERDEVLSKTDGVDRGRQGHVIEREEGLQGIVNLIGHNVPRGLITVSQNYLT